MKKYLLVAVMAAITMSLVSVPVKSVFAQSTNTVTKSITGVDTITWATVASKVRGFQYTATKTSGTVAGKVILEGTINGKTWVGVDSLTLADILPDQTKVTSIAPTAGTTYKGYRYRCTNTSAATIAVVATYLRRSDE